MGKPVVPVSSVLILQEIGLTWIRPGLRCVADEGRLFPRGSPFISEPATEPFEGSCDSWSDYGKLHSFPLRCLLIERLSLRDGGGSGDDDDANDGGDTAAHTPKP
jgi:hypothetical protein